MRKQSAVKFTDGYHCGNSDFKISFAHEILHAFVLQTMQQVPWQRCFIQGILKTVERQPRQVFIYNIEIQSIELPKAYMTVCCSKGTYMHRFP